MATRLVQERLYVPVGALDADEESAVGLIDDLGVEAVLERMAQVDPAHFFDEHARVFSALTGSDFHHDFHDHSPSNVR